jgi:hypothetical protein
MGFGMVNGFTDQIYTRLGTTSNYSATAKSKRGKVILVTGHGGPQGCEASRVPHFLDNQPTDGG